MAVISKDNLLKKMIDMGSAMSMVVLLSVLVGLILAFPVMLLWNFVFGNLHMVNTFQAWALNVLAGILFGQRVSK